MSKKIKRGFILSSFKNYILKKFIPFCLVFIGIRVGRSYLLIMTLDIGWYRIIYVNIWKGGCFILLSH